MIDWELFKQQMQARPGRMLGFVLSIATCFLLLWALVALQTPSAAGPVQVTENNRLDSLRLSLSQPPVDTAGYAGKNTADYEAGVQASSAERRPAGNAWLTFVILGAAVGGLWIWIKKRGPDEAETARRPVLEQIGMQEVGHGQKLSVVKINGEYWVLGVGPSTISLLHRYDSDEWKESALPDLSSEEPEGGVFAALLKHKQAPGKRVRNGSK